VVGQDEREAGLRAILNFGHTFGHAIESGLGYGQWLHGEGVGCGMVMAARLSQRLDLVDAAFVDRLRALVQRAGLPVVGPRLSATDNAGRYLELMRVDKKAQAGEIRFCRDQRPRPCHCAQCAGCAGARGDRRELRMNAFPMVAIKTIAICTRFKRAEARLDA